MAFKPSKSPGVTRLSESDQAREPKKGEENPNKYGKSCVVCNKYFSYLRPQDRCCISCNSRKQSRQ
jgi:regulator of replication initiation timing